jgi:hypothetical protein
MKGAALRILDLGIDTGKPTGKLVLTVLGGIAEFEREIMLERQREGIAKAKAAGKYKARKPTARAKADAVTALKAQGVVRLRSPRSWGSAGLRCTGSSETDCSVTGSISDPPAMVRFAQATDRHSVCHDQPRRVQCGRELSLVGPLAVSCTGEMASAAAV